MKSKEETEKPDRWLTAAQVGELTGFSANQVWNKEGAFAELTRIEIGKRSVRYSEEQVLEWMAAQFQKAKEQQSCQPNNVVELKPRKPKQPNYDRERGKRIIRLVRDRRSNNGSND